VAHANSKTLEVVELVGKTDSVAVDEHPVSGFVVDLVDSQDTLKDHVVLKLLEEVLAETHWPALAARVDTLEVLHDQTVDLGDRVVDLDLGTSEDGRNGGGWGQTLRSLDRCVSTITDGQEEVTEGR